MSIREKRKMIDIKQIVSNGYQIFYSAGGTDEIFRNIMKEIDEFTSKYYC